MFSRHVCLIYFFTFFVINCEILCPPIAFTNKVMRGDFSFLKVLIRNDLVYVFTLSFEGFILYYPYFSSMLYSLVTELYSEMALEYYWVDVASYS